jgi:DNA-binding IclR family transcriptional regulator
MMNSEAEKYPAPALARGLNVLEALNDGGSMTLEELSRTVGYPKASLLRLLETLGALELVRRDEAGKTYTALGDVQFHDETTFIRGVVRKEMKRLTSATGITTEWYERVSDRMEIVDLYDPPHAEVFIRARIGFRRPFRDELEAVTRIGLGVGLYDYSATEYWYYDEEGERPEVSATVRDAQVQEAKDRRVTMDFNWNSNGLRRYAAGVMDGQKLIGILALAETFTPGANKRIESNLKELKQSAVSIARKIKQK